MTTMLLACIASLTLLSCEKIEPVEIPEPQKEEEKQPEDNNNNSTNHDQTITMAMNITAGGRLSAPRWPTMQPPKNWPRN